MNFTETIFLLGAFAVIGPILAHLLIRPKYRRIPFTMLHFLQTGRREMQSRRNLKNLIMLIIRCLIIALLAAAFAGPRWLTRSAPQTQDKTCLIAIDDSLSMTYKHNGSDLFSAMADQAVTNIDKEDANTRFRIYGLASNRRWLNLDAASAKTALRELTPVPREASLDDFIADARQAAQQGSVTVHLLSDFTNAFASQLRRVTEPVFVENCRYHIAPLDETPDNLAVTDAKIQNARPDQLYLQVTVANYGRTAPSRRLDVKILDKIIQGPAVSPPPANDDDAESKINYTVKIPLDSENTNISDTRFLPLELALNENDGVKSDDAFYLAVGLQPEQRINVLLIGRDDRQLFLFKTALDVLSRSGLGVPYNCRTATPDSVSPADVRKAKIIIAADVFPGFANQLPLWKSFVRQGGRLICFLSPQTPIDEASTLYTNDLLACRPKQFRNQPARIQLAGPDVTRDELSPDGRSRLALTQYPLDRIVLTGFYQTDLDKNTNCLWLLREDQGFVFYKSVGQGAAVTINTSIDDSMGSLAKSDAILAFCRYLIGTPSTVQTYCAVIGDPLFLPSTELEDKSYTPADTLWVNPPAGKPIEARLDQGGIRVTDSDQLGWFRTTTLPIRYFGVNPPPGETRMTRPNDDQIKQLVTQIFPTTQNDNTNTNNNNNNNNNNKLYNDSLAQHTAKPIWKLFIITLIALLLLETFLANRLKR